MTIKMPNEGLSDKILKALNKKRGVKVPTAIFEDLGFQQLDVTVVAQKESFWKALLRPKDQALPEEFFNLYDFEKLKDSSLG